MKLPQKLYEVLRWCVWVVLPATATLISALNTAWNWGLPIDAILTTFSGVEVFLGTVLGIAKISNDKEISLEAEITKEVAKNAKKAAKKATKKTKRAKKTK